MADNLQLRSVATLPVLSDPSLLENRYLRPAFEAALGTAGNFKVERWPAKTEEFLRNSALELSHAVKENGQIAGRELVTKFDERKTRFSPEMISRAWDGIDDYFQGKINEGWQKEDNEIPGLVEGLNSIVLTPFSEEGRRITERHSSEKIQTELGKVAEGLRTHDFFEKARNILFYSWVLELGLRETEQPSLKAEIQSELQKGMK